jgi:hypothetical protein
LKKSLLFLNSNAGFQTAIKREFKIRFFEKICHDTLFPIVVYNPPFLLFACNFFDNDQKLLKLGAISK